MTFGEILKSLRKEKKITQQDLADYLNFTRPAITNYETGRKEPEIDTLKKIATFFDVSVDYLLGLTDIKNPYANISNNKEQNRLLHSTKDLSTESQKLLDEYIKLLNMKDSIKKAEDESTPTAENA